MSETEVMELVKAQSVTRPSPTPAYMSLAVLVLVPYGLLFPTFWGTPSFTVRVLGVIAALVHCLLSFAVVFPRRDKPAPPNDPVPWTYRRGRLRLPIGYARQRMREWVAEHPPLAYSVRWMGFTIPDHATEPNFLVVGAQGSGKTLLLKELMLSVFRLVEKGYGIRALVFDAKRDIVPFISKATSAQIHILDPLDARGEAWDMAADLMDPAAARHVASILVPEPQGQESRFWTESARLLLHGILHALILSVPGRWTLRDVLVFVRNPTRAKQLLTSFPLTADVLSLYGGTDVAALNAFQTLYATLAHLEPVAAAWEKAEKRFSLSRWMEEESIVVLGNDWMHASILSAINRVLFRRLVELVLTQPDTREAHTWFFLDELKESGRLEGLNQLMTNGRSKGARVACAFQDLRGLQSVLGEKEADEIVGLCGYTSFLRLSSEPTAEWASRVLGEIEFWQDSWTHGQYSSVTWSVVTKRAVLASELLSVSPPDNMRIWGSHLIPPVNMFVHMGRIPCDLQCTAIGPPKSAFVKRDKAHLTFGPWDDADWERLGLNQKRPTSGSHHLVDCKRVRFDESSDLIGGALT